MEAASFDLTPEFRVLKARRGVHSEVRTETSHTCVLIFCSSRKGQGKIMDISSWRPRPRPLPSEVRDKRQRANECRWAHPAFQSSNEAKERDQAKPAQQSDKVGYCFTVGQSLRRTAQQNAERSASLPSLAPPFETKTVLVGEGRREREGAREGFRLRVSFKPRCNYRKQRRE